MADAMKPSKPKKASWVFKKKVTRHDGANTIVFEINDPVPDSLDKAIIKDLKEHELIKEVK